MFHSCPLTLSISTEVYCESGLSPEIAFPVLSYDTFVQNSLPRNTSRSSGPRDKLVLLGQVYIGEMKPKFAIMSE